MDSGTKAKAVFWLTLLASVLAVVLEYLSKS